MLLCFVDIYTMILCVISIDFNQPSDIINGSNGKWVPKQTTNPSL